MRKLLTVICCVLGFVLIAAPIYVKYSEHALTMNGKPFAKAYFINQQWVLAVDEFLKLGGANLTAEPGFKIQGNQLIGLLLPAVQTENKKFNKVEASAMPNTIGGSTLPVANTGSSFNKPTVGQKADIAIIMPGGFHVRKAGVISHDLFMYNGKAYFPLADAVRAFGGGLFTAPGKLNSGQALSLNFTVNGDGILAFNQ